MNNTAKSVKNDLDSPNSKNKGNMIILPEILLKKILKMKISNQKLKSNVSKKIKSIPKSSVNLKMNPK